eukprot:4958774-Ditylum_brightwellii.AAC.1
MGSKEFSEDNCHTVANIKMETLNMLGEWGIIDQILKNCECVFTTDNRSGNTGKEGIETFVSRITCTDHRISTVLTEVLNKKQWSIGGQPKSIYVYEEQILFITKLIDR